MFFLAGIFSALMLSGLVVMIDSDEDGQFDDTENLEDNGFEARKMQEDRFVTGSDAPAAYNLATPPTITSPAQSVRIRSTAMRAMIAFLAGPVVIF